MAFRLAISPALLLLLNLHSFSGYTQTGDTVQKLQEVRVRAYLSEQPILRLPSSVTVVDSRLLSSQPGVSLVPALNTVPGVRMEERSPGSYRLSIRGSLLRSPFGVRNIKVYMDEFPLTDAGGNTYLNSIDAKSVSGMEILKGPDGSLFGANSGGVILINPSNTRADSSAITAELTGGSYNSIHENLNLRQRFSNHLLQVNQAFLHSNGYREHSRLKRHYGQVRYNFNYSEGHQLRLLTFYSDLDYKTPGGLTLNQYDADPEAARPATAVSPGAIEQQAGIMNKTYFGGILNESKLTAQLQHTFALFGSHTDFENPFITNYETRRENTGGVRSYLEWKPEARKNFTWKANAGLEWQQTQAEISNFNNIRGEKGALQSSDKLSAQQFFYFSRLSGTFFGRLDIEAAASINNYRYQFNDQNNSEVVFDPQLMPRLAISYQITENAAWRNILSRGYSPPAVAEIRASDQRINTELQPEKGWNLETGLRVRNFNDRVWMDLSLFHYKLQKAIVRRVNADDTEFFINAGGTRQTGLEAQISAWLIPPDDYGLLRGLQFRNSMTFNNFKFRDYQSGGNNFSGNRLTGVPEQVVVSSADIAFPASFRFFIQHNFTSKIPLDDTNNNFAGHYNLVQLKLSWQQLRKPSIELFAGVDNVLNEKYSLGNDLNAFGGRYYNAAPLRNFFMGLKAGL